MIVDYTFPRLRTRGTLYVCSLARTRTMYILNSVAFVKALTAYHDHDLHVELCSSVACVRSLMENCWFLFILVDCSKGSRDLIRHLNFEYYINLINILYYISKTASRCKLARQLNSFAQNSWYEAVEDTWLYSPRYPIEMWSVFHIRYASRVAPRWRQRAVGIVLNRLKTNQS